jgi:hypothetical protein
VFWSWYFYLCYWRFLSHNRDLLLFQRCTKTEMYRTVWFWIFPSLMNKIAVILNVTKTEMNSTVRYCCYLKCVRNWNHCTVSSCAFPLTIENCCYFKSVQKCIVLYVTGVFCLTYRISVFSKVYQTEMYCTEYYLSLPTHDSELLLVEMYSTVYYWSLPSRDGELLLCQRCERLKFTVT